MKPSEVRKRGKYSCSKKIRYASEPSANDQVRPYHCIHCGGWHMTKIVPYADSWKSPEQLEQAIIALAKKWRGG
jgi:hypothetical protein